MAASASRGADVTKQHQEEDLLTMVRGTAQHHGWLTYHTKDSRGSEPGWPDLVLVRAPTVLFVELKPRGGKATPAQWRWIQALSACGLDARVVPYDSFEMRRLFADLQSPRCMSATTSPLMSVAT